MNVLKIAGATWILVVLYSAYMLYIKKYEWPPIVNKCPDYWTEGPSGCIQPAGDSTNYTDIAGCTSGGVKNFTDMSECEKQKWARTCQVSWDGVSNQQSACDQYAEAEDLSSSNKYSFNSLF